MSYENLGELILQSKSSRSYFLSLPVPMQMTLHRQGDFIHSAADLRMQAEAVEQYEKFMKLGEEGFSFKS